MEVNITFFDGASVILPKRIVKSVSVKTAVTAADLDLKEMELIPCDANFYHEKNLKRPQFDMQDYKLQGKVPKDRRARNSLMAIIHHDKATQRIYLSDVNPLLGRGRLSLKLDIAR